MHPKVNILLFIIGAILSILSGILVLSDTFAGASVLLLIIIGVFIGILNIDATEEAGFLLAALVYLFSVFFVTPYMEAFPVLTNLSQILINIAIMTASATTIVSLRWVFTFASGTKAGKILAKTDKKKELAKIEKTWAVVMLFAVAVVIVQVVLETFFDTTSYTQILEIIDYVVLGIFVVDLVIIYLEVKSFSKFIKIAWLDIIATIPFNMFFRIFKLVRIIRVVKVLTKVQKASRFARVNRALKFFSHKSKFNEYVKEKK